MLYLEDRFQKAVPFVAAEHDDHSPHRHTHILAVLPGRLSPQDLAALRGVATEAALFQRQERDWPRRASAWASELATGEIPARAVCKLFVNTLTERLGQ
jgi:hypothetical protein